MDEILLDKLLSMAKLELSPQARMTMLADLGRVCDWVEQLQSVDTNTAEPLTTLASHTPILREDIPQTPLDHSRARGLVDSPGGEYFSVPNFRKPS